MTKRLITERDWPIARLRRRLTDGSGHIPQQKPLPFNIQTHRIRRGVSEYTKMMRRIDKAKGRRPKQPVNLVIKGLFKFYTTK